jgi:hypothetical protein
MLHEEGAGALVKWAPLTFKRKEHCKSRMPCLSFVKNINGCTMKFHSREDENVLISLVSQ